MKSKETNMKQSIVSKTAKAALPVFALFGGQGFASSRNPLTMQSSKKVAGKSVVYINDATAPELPTLGAQAATTTKSPFAAFTNQKINKTKNADVVIKSDALSFLNKNNLLSAKNTVTSNVSGNTLNRKTFSDDWQWSTRQVGTGYAYLACVSGATYGGSPLSFHVWSYNSYVASQFVCYTNPGSVQVSNTNSAAILGQCQAMHMACDGQPLPVELMKFEVE